VTKYTVTNKLQVLKGHILLSFDLVVLFHCYVSYTTIYLCNYLKCIGKKKFLCMIFRRKLSLLFLKDNFCIHLEWSRSNVHVP